MSEPLLTKRLHISGLTPSITSADLEHRLSSFGKVKAMDGFGARDALGDPRKFGFVTMEIGVKELAKCLNVLSGSTWKGAKLRIGEAKPDFQERLVQINSQPARPVRSKRTYARNHGYVSSTLPLVPLSATAAASAPGWILTPSGRVVRPMRVRPVRPLEPTRSELSASVDKSRNGKVKKRTKPPPVRARRRLIDPTKWDSVYLKGVFLDAVPVLPIPRDSLEHPTLAKHDIVDEEEDDGTDDDTFPTPPHPDPQLVQDHVRTVQSAQRLPEAPIATSSRIHEVTESIDVREEANAALTMFGKMFGDKEDWDGRENVDEGLEDDEARDEMQVDGEDDIETVPHNFGEGRKITKDKGKSKEKLAGDVVCSVRDDEVDADEALNKDVDMEDGGPPVSTPVQTAGPASQINLKALFAPKEDASFSLVNHLDLDLDLDLELGTDILGINAPQENDHRSEPISSTLRVNVIEIPATTAAANVRSRVTLDPSLPLLFPIGDSLPYPYTPPSNSATTTRHRSTSCFLFPSTTRVRGLYHLPSSITFTRSCQDTPESIRERWEKDKFSLTREWKKAWREARGSRRGRVGSGGEIGIGGGY